MEGYDLWSGGGFWEVDDGWEEAECLELCVGRGIS